MRSAVCRGALVQLIGFGGGSGFLAMRQVSAGSYVGSIRQVSAATSSPGATWESAGPLNPVGHSRRAKFAAVTAPHTRAEERHRGIIRPVVHIDCALMAAVLAGHEQAPHAMTAHGAERHGSDWFVIPGHAGS
jgi:hypothetical protein